MSATTRVFVKYSAGAYTAAIGKMRKSSTMSAETAVRRVADAYLAQFDGMVLVDVSCLSGSDYAGPETWEIEFKLEGE